MDPVISTIISICIALLFGSAAIGKLKAPTVFRAAIDAYRLLPTGLVNLISGLFIATELLAAVMVLIPSMRLAGCILIAALLIIYSAAMTVNLIKGRRDIDCGCNGPASKQALSWWLVGRNLVLLVFVILAMQPENDRVLNWLDSLTIVFGIMLASGLYMSLNQLMAQSPALNNLRGAA